MFIDPHVHLRDFNQAEKETIKHGLEVARDSGVVAVIDMPNTDPPIMTHTEIDARLDLVKKADVPEVSYNVFMGLTKNIEQIKWAIDAYNNYKEIPGFKIYMAHSVGMLGITKFMDQFDIFENLTAFDYKGPVVVHCEKESHMHPEFWTPSSPITHCHAQPEESEIESAKDLVTILKQTNFQGKVHVAHISSPSVIDLIQEAKSEGMDITSGVCPHHLIYDWKQMFTDDGILYKMNPPLRAPESKIRLFNYLLAGLVDMIETDHAPHTLADKKDKEKGTYMSGLPGLACWPMFREYLRYNNFSEEQIEKLTFYNAAKRFKLDVNMSKRKLIDRRADYAFDPYLPIAKEIGWDERKNN